MRGMNQPEISGGERNPESKDNIAAKAAKNVKNS
jgi:hypothetical protein